MAKPRATARETLVRDLLKFLAVECPPLLPTAREVCKKSKSAAPAAICKRLRGELEKMTALPDNEGVAQIYPGASADDAAEWYRKYLDDLLEGFFRRKELQAGIRVEEKLQMYRWMVLTRTLDTRLKELFDKKDVKWGDFPSPMKGFRSWGQEAIVGAALRLRRGSGDVVAPLIRDLGLMLAWTNDLDRGVLPPAAPLAIASQTLIGIAYAFKMDGSDNLCVSCIGEGGSSLGEWHEAINFAAVQRLNMIFFVQNNQWAMGTHVSEQSAVKRFALKAPGYGVPGITIFGNDPEEIAAATAWAAERARSGKGPTLIELVTYRRTGHAHHDDSRFHGTPEREGYEFEEERELWAAADPVDLYRERLRAGGLLPETDEVTEEAQRLVDEATERMRQTPWPTPEVMTEVYAPREDKVAEPKEPRTRPAGYDEAIRLALTELMQEDDRVFLLGEDIGGRYGGAFGVTRGLAKRFGESRCLNTPLAESAIVGCAVGAALMGKRPIAEMQFADFLASGFNALVNNAPKIYWRYRKPVPMVVRLPYGGATRGMQSMLGGGPFHTQCPESWFVRTPGWKIVAPAFPSDAKGLLAAAVRDPNPVIYLEAKGLYSFFSRDLREAVPLGAEFEVPLGKAQVRREGTDISCVAYGPMVFAALEAAEELARNGIDVEVIDLRSLVPLDEETVLESVRKTGRVLIVHEDTKRGGFGGEVAALIAEHAIWNLDAPILRVAAPDTPVPYAPPLEYAFLPKAKDVVGAAYRLMEGKA